MKKLLSVLFVFIMLFMVVSCDMVEKDDDDEEGDATISFDEICENLRKMPNDKVEFDIISGETDGRDLLSECFGKEIESEYKGKIKNSLYCENEGEGAWWCIMAFQCGSEKEAKQLRDIIEENFYDKDWEKAVYRVEGNILLAGTNEQIIKIALGKNNPNNDDSSSFEDESSNFEEQIKEDIKNDSNELNDAISKNENELVGNLGNAIGNNNKQELENSFDDFKNEYIGCEGKDLENCLEDLAKDFKDVAQQLPDSNQFKEEFDLTADKIEGISNDTTKTDEEKKEEIDKILDEFQQSINSILNSSLTFETVLQNLKKEGIIIDMVAESKNASQQLFVNVFGESEFPNVLNKGLLIDLPNDTLIFECVDTEYAKILYDFFVSALDNEIVCKKTGKIVACSRNEEFIDIAFGEYEAEEESFGKNGGGQEQLPPEQDEETTTQEPEEPKEPEKICNGDDIHDWGKWIWDEATCTTPRTGVRECTTCGFLETAYTSASLGHSYDITQAYAMGARKKCGVCGYEKTAIYTNHAPNAGEISIVGAYGANSTDVLTDGKWTIPFTIAPNGGPVTITFEFATPVDIDQISFLASSGAGTYKVTAILANGAEVVLGTLTGAGQAAWGDTTGPVGTMDQTENATILTLRETLENVEKLVFYAPSSSSGTDAIGEIGILEKVDFEEDEIIDDGNNTEVPDDCVHSGTWVWTEATCTTPKTGKRECIVCGWIEMTSTGGALGHDYGEYQVTTDGRQSVCESCGDVKKIQYINQAITASDISITGVYGSGSTGVFVDGKWTIPYMVSPSGRAVTITFDFNTAIDIDQISFLASSGAGTYEVTAILANGDEVVLGTLTGKGQAAWGDTTGPVGTMDQTENATILTLSETLENVEKLVFYAPSSSQGNEAIGEIAILQAPSENQSTSSSAGLADNMLN